MASQTERRGTFRRQAVSARDIQRFIIVTPYKKCSGIYATMGRWDAGMIPPLFQERQGRGKIPLLCASAGISAKLIGLDEKT